jgi:hypothetical protein
MGLLYLFLPFTGMPSHQVTYSTPDIVDHFYLSQGCPVTRSHTALLILRIIGIYFYPTSFGKIL